MRCFFICWWWDMCEAGSDMESPTGPRFGGRPGLELHDSRELLGLTMIYVSSSLWVGGWLDLIVIGKIICSTFILWDNNYISIISVYKITPTNRTLHAFTCPSIYLNNRIKASLIKKKSTQTESVSHYMWKLWQRKRSAIRNKTTSMFSSSNHNHVLPNKNSQQQ